MKRKRRRRPFVLICTRRRACDPCYANARISRIMSALAGSLAPLVASGSPDSPPRALLGRLRPVACAACASRSEPHLLSNIIFVEVGARMDEYILVNEIRGSLASCHTYDDEREHASRPSAGLANNDENTGSAFSRPAAGRLLNHIISASAATLFGMYECAPCTRSEARRHAQAMSGNVCMAMCACA